MFDLKEFCPKETTIVEIIDPRTQDDSGVRVEVYGPDSAHYKNSVLKISRQKEIQGKKKKDSPEEIADKKGTKLAIACVKNWWHVEDEKDKTLLFDGEKLSCVERNVARVLKAAPTIRRQVEATILTESSFLPEAEKN